jgi:uncharacterized membrane protein
MGSDNQENNRTQEHWMEYILPISLIAGLVALLTIVIDSPLQGYTPLIPNEAILSTILGYIIVALEIATAYVIVAAMARATLSYTRHLFDPINRQINYTERIRLRLGHMLNLGLEFAIGSDVLRLAIAPSSRDIVILFTKVLLRILLNYFLDREIRASEELCGPGNYIPPMVGIEDDDENV